MATLPKRPTKSVEELVEEQAAREAAFAAEHAAADQEIATALRARQLEVERRRTELEAEAEQQNRAAEIARRARTDRYLAKRRELEEESGHLSFLNDHDESKYHRPPEPKAPSEEPKAQEEPEPAPEPQQEPVEPRQAAAPATEQPTVINTTVNIGTAQPEKEEPVDNASKGTAVVRLIVGLIIAGQMFIIVMSIGIGQSVPYVLWVILSAVLAICVGIFTASFAIPRIAQALSGTRRNN